MIVSHKYKFIFVKTYKTAGTSLEVFLSQLCGDDDIVTPIFPHVPPHEARNYSGYVNIISEIYKNRGFNVSKSLESFFRKPKFYNHMPASSIKQRLPKHVWDNYYKFCVERNPWDKTLSHYHMMNSRLGGNVSLDDYFMKCGLCHNFSHYTDRNHNLLVDHVIKYENFNEELSNVFSRLGVPFDGHLGVRAKSEYRSDKVHYRDIFTEQQKQLISEKFSDEIRMHNYEY